MNQRIFSQINEEVGLKGPTSEWRSLVALVTKASTQRRVGEKDAFKILKNLVHGVLSAIHGYSQTHTAQGNADNTLYVDDLYHDLSYTGAYRDFTIPVWYRGESSLAICQRRR